MLEYKKNSQDFHPAMKTDETRLLRLQLAHLARQENRFLRFRSGKGEDVDEGKIRSKIPAKLLSTLESAFQKGFAYIFDKGTSLIEKSGNLTGVREEAADHYALLSRGITKERLKNFDISAGNRSWTNKGLTTLEGAALGVFGIGLPAIPVFLGVLFKTVYEISASYGFDYKSPAERAYILALIRVAASQGGDRLMESRNCDRLGERIDNGLYDGDGPTPEDIQIASNRLASSTLVAKFVQGITFVGVLGAGFNYYWIHRVSRIALMKYKRRFLTRLLTQRQPAP